MTQNLYNNFIKSRLNDILRSYKRKRLKGFDGGLNIVVDIRLLIKGKDKTREALSNSINEILEDIDIIKGNNIELYFPKRNKKFMHVFVNTCIGKKQLKYQLNSRDIDYGFEYLTREDTWYNNIICL